MTAQKKKQQLMPQTAIFEPALTIHPNMTIITVIRKQKNASRYLSPTGHDNNRT